MLSNRLQRNDFKLCIFYIWSVFKLPLRVSGATANTVEMKMKKQKKRLKASNKFTKRDQFQHRIDINFLQGFRCLKIKLNLQLFRFHDFGRRNNV